MLLPSPAGYGIVNIMQVIKGWMSDTYNFISFPA